MNVLVSEMENESQKKSQVLIVEMFGTKEMNHCHLLEDEVGVELLQAGIHPRSRH